jgi:hypothetical protein
LRKGIFVLHRHRSFKYFFERLFLVFVEFEITLSVGYLMYKCLLLVIGIWELWGRKWTYVFARHRRCLMKPYSRVRQIRSSQLQLGSL